MVKITKEPMGNGYDHFICPSCKHDNPMVMSSPSMQLLLDMSDKVNCESCRETFEVSNVQSGLQ